MKKLPYTIYYNYLVIHPNIKFRMPRYKQQICNIRIVYASGKWQKNTFKLAKTVSFHTLAIHNSLITLPLDTLQSELLTAAFNKQ